MTGQRRDQRQDVGFSLLELLVAMTIFGTLVAMSAPTLSNFGRAADQRDLAQSTASALRNAGQRAVAEQRSYCVSFTSTRSRLYRGACATGTDLGVLTTATGRNAFVVPALGGTSECTFLPRGSTSGCLVHVVRQGNPTVIPLLVNRLSGRVSRA